MCQYLNTKDTFPPQTCSAIMDVKVVLVIVCLCILAITSSEAGIPKCCLHTKHKIRPRTLMNVKRWEMQKSSGECEIKALVLYLKGYEKPICAHPSELRRLKRMKIKRP
uniref:C-C motif chemokine n=1 Tax=Haplochromis burtoni TaxID=8153 RepID=A0A3Q2WB34_HAPBU